MINQIQTLLQSVNKKQAGFGVVAFCGGFGLGLYLNRQGVVEAVIEPEELDEHDLGEPIGYIEELIETDEGLEASIVLSPKGNDPGVIQVDMDAIRRRDELITAHGYDEGMRIYQEEYSMGTEIPVETDEEQQEEEAEVINIFASEDPEWDQEEEDKKRSGSSGPYILHKDEFWNSETDYTQLTLTYYAGDNILCSEDNTPVYNADEVVGELKFGHGSQDRNVVYIRNDKLKAEYEILRDRGHYRIEVLGMEAEEAQERAQLKHSLRKFRPDD